MRKSIIFLWLAVITSSIAAAAWRHLPALHTTHTAYAWKAGDIVFQQSISPQCEAIQCATHSPWTHVGVVLKHEGQWMVLEAIHPVSYTPVEEFMERSQGKVLVKRLKDTSALTPEVLRCMHAYGEANEGKYYDMEFGWSDERLYCSELVYKLYMSCTGLSVGKPQPLSAFDLSHPVVQETLEERYDAQIPLNELMIAPGAMADSPLLVTLSPASSPRK